MEVIIPVGVSHSIASDSRVALTRGRFNPGKVEESPKQEHRDFPDPRLFDFDDNGTVDANDIIQEHQTRRETLNAVSAKTPLAKYVVQLEESKPVDETIPQASVLPPKISIFA